MVQDHPVRLLIVAWLCLVGCRCAQAQHLVYAEDGDHFSLVQGAEEHFPLIQKGDRLVHAHGSRLALKTVDEYAPFYVGIRNMHARSVDNIFHFGVELVSPYPLHNVFICLTLNTEKGESSFVWGVGELKAYVTRPVRFNAPTRSRVGAGQYQIHVFADGPEVFTSLMLPDQIETALDQMVLRRTRDLTDANPQLFMGPVPEFPETLRGKHISGKATVECEISTPGTRASLRREERHESRVRRRRDRDGAAVAFPAQDDWWAT